MPFSIATSINHLISPGTFTGRILGPRVQVNVTPTYPAFMTPCANKLPCRMLASMLDETIQRRKLCWLAHNLTCEWSAGDPQALQPVDVKGHDLATTTISSRDAHMVSMIIAYHLGVPRFGRQIGQKSTLNTSTNFLIRTSMARMFFIS